MGAHRIVAAVALAVVAALGVAAFVLGGSAGSLLTPLPSGWVGPTIGGAFVLALALAWAVGRAVRPGLLRRLTVLGVLAGTVYSTGQATRGAYVAAAFSGTVERDVITLRVNTARAGEILAFDLGTLAARSPSPRLRTSRPRAGWACA